MSSYSSVSVGISSARVSRVNRDTVPLVLVGLFCLLITEQVATGWLALGEQVNVSRRDLNLLEYVVIALSGLWGLLSLATAMNVAVNGARGSLRRYFDESGSMPAPLRYAVLCLALAGLICLLIAAQVLTGWLPLAARANIPRSNINGVEWITIVLAAVWGLVCLRATLGILRREQRAWTWGQWILLANAIIGFILLLSAVFDLPGIVPRQGTLFDNLTGVLRLLAPGLILAFTSISAYRLLITDYGDPIPQKAIAGTLAERARARDIRAARLPAGQTIRNRLAASPGAGAIIGFLALFTFFSVATDLFLTPGSLAGALTNNVTRGIVAIGATMLMISGEFDLSVGSLLGIGGLTFLGLLTGEFPPGGPQLDPLSAALLTLLFVGFLGSLNGFILIRTGIPSFIVTLATMLMLRGIPLVFIAGGRNIRYVDYFREPPYFYVHHAIVALVALALAGVVLLIARTVVPARVAAFRSRLQNSSADDGDFRELALVATFLYLVVTVVIVAVLLATFITFAIGQVSELLAGSQFFRINFFDLMNGRIASLPLIGQLPTEINLRIGVLWWFVLVLIFQFVLNQTRYGNATFATGGNAGAALAQGINVRRVKVTNFIIVAVLAGFAGILDASRLQSVDALRGQFLELEVIAATVIGGALLSGGYGSIIGALLGVFIFGMMQTGLVLIGVDARLFDAFIGAIILGAVIINTASRRVKS